MLNISPNGISEYVNSSAFKSFGLLRKSRVKRMPVFVAFGITLIAILCLFLPWTQNVRAKGYVTTFLPNQRPQSIPSIIAGRVDKWYVMEGDYVQKGDTIVALSEVKSEYMDPNLIDRTAEQLTAKSEGVATYQAKVNALKSQYRALQNNMDLKIAQTENKIEQARNKIQIDSIDLDAFKANEQIALNQLERVRELHEKGLKSLSELQEKELKVQQLNAKVNSQRNKLINQRNELLNLKMQLASVEAEYQDKMAKSLSEQQSAIAARYEGVSSAAKLQNQLNTYTVRQQYYTILAPQDGYVTKVMKKGIGEIIKEGADIVTIVPDIDDLAVEVYVKPMDLPLIDIGESVQLRFDGWPAIVISGWPEGSTGVFSGKVYAVDRYNSENGLYRIMVRMGDTEKKWPDMLRVGTGVNAFILLQDVPIWYELWRNLNGFPPDYYQENLSPQDELKLKAPLKSVK